MRAVGRGRSGRGRSSRACVEMFAALRGPPPLPFACVTRGQHLGDETDDEEERDFASAAWAFDLPSDGGEVRFAATPTQTFLPRPTTALYLGCASVWLSWEQFFACIPSCENEKAWIGAETAKPALKPWPIGRWILA